MVGKTVPFKFSGGRHNCNDSSRVAEFLDAEEESRPGRAVQTALDITLFGQQIQFEKPQQRETQASLGSITCAASETAA